MHVWHIANLLKNNASLLLSENLSVFWKLYIENVSILSNGVSPQPGLRLATWVKNLGSKESSFPFPGKGRQYGEHHGVLFPSVCTASF